MSLTQAMEEVREVAMEEVGEVAMEEVAMVEVAMEEMAMEEVAMGEEEVEEEVMGVATILITLTEDMDHQVTSSLCSLCLSVISLWPS